MLPEKGRDTARDVILKSRRRILIFQELKKTAVNMYVYDKSSMRDFAQRNQ